MIPTSPFDYYALEVEIPSSMAQEIEGISVGEKVKATLSYEAIEKTETYLRVRITSILAKNKKRIT